jgi:hypothetical protein
MRLFLLLRERKQLETIENNWEMGQFTNVEVIADFGIGVAPGCGDF